MELHQLRYFVAVAELRHFTRAARNLRIAQPSVSRAIRVLEEELGTPLFHRMTGNVALTSAGAVLLPWAIRVLADVDGAALPVRELARLRRGRPLARSGARGSSRRSLSRGARWTACFAWQRRASAWPSCPAS